MTRFSPGQRDSRSSYPPADSERREGDPRSMKRRRTKILVIDDSEIVLETTRVLLESCGFDVALCGSPIGAALRASREQPDLVLVDLDMATMPGDRLIAALKSGTRTAHIPVCIYTGAEPRQAIAAARRANADGIIEKGCDEMTLVAAIRRALRP